MWTVLSPLKVAPLVGAWIEMPLVLCINIIYKVAPLVGAWIEIPNNVWLINAPIVAPLVGAWIEIVIYGRCLLIMMSLPLWERGLKYVKH